MTNIQTAVCQLSSLSPLSFSRHHDEPKLKNEPADEYEKRTWREKCHAHDDGTIYIPPMMFKKALDNAAAFLGMKVPGRGMSRFGSIFRPGTLITDGIDLPIKKDKVLGEWLFVNADGRSGSGKRVKRCFPVIHEWSGELTVYIVDRRITEDIFAQHMEAAGQFTGIGRFTPKSGGFYGRFKIDDIAWNESAMSDAA